MQEEEPGKMLESAAGQVCGRGAHPIGSVRNLRVSFDSVTP